VKQRLRYRLHLIPYGDELGQSLCFNLQFQPRITRIASMKETGRSRDMELASEASEDARVTNAG
jgi:hypothetical protein